MVYKKVFAAFFKYFILVISALTVLLPIWLLFVSTFRQSVTILRYPPTFWPESFNLENYIFIMTSPFHTFPRWFFNSFFVSVANTLLVMLTSSLAAYAFAKRDFYGKNVIMSVIIASMMFPTIITLIPSFLIVAGLGWINSYPGLIFPSVASAFGVFLVTQFMKTIPNSLVESARMDGSNEFRTFLHIVLPITLPAMGVLAIFTFFTQWSSLMWPMVIINESKMMTLPLGISTMHTTTNQNQGAIMAATFFSFLPVIVVFMFMRETFVEGITAGSVKG